MFCVGLLGFAGLVRAEEWPQYRGPNGDGISRETGLLKVWPEGGPKKLWSVPVGIGHASPIAVDGKIYLFTRNEDKKQEVLDCLDAETGKTIWSEAYTGGYDHMNKDWKGSRATPTIDGNFIYTFGSQGHLVCRNLSDGKAVWTKNVVADTKAEPIEWGQASSPLIVGNHIFVQNGRGAGCPVAVAVDKQTGKIVWESEAKGVAKEKAKNKNPTGGSYANIIQIEIGGIKQLIVFAGTDLYGMSPESGKTIWKEAWVTDYDINAATPLFKSPHLFVSSGYGHGSMMLELTATSAKKLWENKTLLQDKFPGPILENDVIYANSEGVVKAISWPDGKMLWEAKSAAERIGPGGSILRVGDQLIVQSERGKLALMNATPGEYKFVSTVKTLTPGTNLWATPLIYKGRLYVKGREELICLDIRQQ